MRFGKHCLLVFALTLLPGTALSGQPYQGPIIDAHGHLGASFNWETMVEVMDSNNVTRRTVMARYYPGGGRTTCRAAALCVTRPGAADAIPALDEIEG